jgi:hypothetical protein
VNGTNQQTREQRIVACLQGALPTDAQKLKKFRARALDLPSMLRRHGLMHVLLFLNGKEGSDRELAGFLHQGIEAAVGPDQAAASAHAYAERLPGMELPLYLLHMEAAQQSATWLKLLVEARTKAPAPPRDETAGSPEP